MGINSSITVAGGVSAQLSKAASGFTAVNQVTTTASKTSVCGNNNAKNSLMSVHSRSQRLSNAIARDANNIHSVAKEFAAIDQKVKNGFDGLALNGLKLW